MTDAIRLAVGTLTVLRVPAPRRVDKSVGGRAMALAPLVGLLVGLLAAFAGQCADWLGLPPLVCAVVVVGALAVLTRGMHLDGLADTADGLGSGRQGEDALAVMSRSDIGPFGVVTLVLTLLLQVSCLAAVWAAGDGPAAVVVAVVASRAVLPLTCRVGVPAAKATGLGAVVAASVRTPVLIGALAAAFAISLVAGAATDGAGGAASALAATVVALVVASLLLRRCVSRFGGVTGDVLGAGVETATAAALVTLAIGLV